VEGRVIKTTGSWQWVQIDNGMMIQCQTRGKLRMEGFTTTNPVAVGDRVRIELDEKNMTGSN